ncbi:MAG: GTPase Der [Leptospiraceae bacterium]|nr:MAG: GTPase Der [Leptospiraceae bacterium]
MITKKKLKKIAIVGKKNAGKSSLLNLLARKNRSIVDDYPGLTRDIIEIEIKNYGVHALFYDLPGLDVIDLGEEKNYLESLAKEKAYKFLSEEVDLIIHLMEPPAPSPFDFDFRDYFNKVLKTKKIEVLNKIDSKEKEMEYIPNFLEEGFKPIPISVKSRYNISHFINTIKDILPEISINEQDIDYEEQFINKKGYKDSTVVSDYIKDDIRIAIVGKPNVGKSTLFNLWAGKDISLVSDIPGTTRDTIDTVFKYFGKTIRILDTAGLRKKRVLEDHIEFISSRRTRRAIQDSDIVIQVISAPDGLTEYDKKIISLIDELNKPMILFINKWDIMPGKHDKLQKEYLESLYYYFPFLKHVPIYFGSALTKKRAMEPLKKIIELNEKLNFRIQTSQLNRYLEKLLQQFPHHQRFKIYYATQVSERPPVFVLFCNNKKLVKRNFIVFLENKIREDFKLEGIPIRIKLKDKDED